MWLILWLVASFPGHEMRQARKAPSMRIVITSSANNIDRRHACRETWLKWVKDTPNGLSYSFYIQAPTTADQLVRIHQEAAVHQDIVFINATAPEVFGEACSFRRWEALAHERRMLHDKVDYFALVDDDSFVCIHHLLSDSKHWPVKKRVHIGHFRQFGVDVISIYSKLLVKDALKVTATHPLYMNKTHELHTLVLRKAIKKVDNINDPRLTFGARGYKEKRYNDFANGWIGVDLLNATEKHTLCNRFLSFHQVYPKIMLDLWSHISTNPAPEEFAVPALSRNINNLDSTEGYQ